MPENLKQSIFRDAPTSLPAKRRLRYKRALLNTLACTEERSHRFFSALFVTNVIVCEDPVGRKLKAIKPNKSAGPDDVPPKLLKLPEPSIVSPLTGLFSFCAQLGETFTDWKKARLNAVYKKDEADPNNYLTIIPRAQMGSKSIAQEAEVRITIESDAMKARGIIF